jgi:hypothetical protein
MERTTCSRNGCGLPATWTLTLMWGTALHFCHRHVIIAIEKAMEGMDIASVQPGQHFDIRPCREE